MPNIYDVNAAIDKPQWANAFAQGRMNGQQMKQNALAIEQAQMQRADQNALRTLAPQIIAGDPAAYQQAAAIDPRAAGQYEQAGSNQFAKLRNMVDYIDRAKKTGNQAALSAALNQAWPYIKQAAPGAPDTPPTAFTPEMEQGWEALKAKVAMAGSGPESANVHSAFRGQNGNMWVLGRDGQVRDTGAPFDPNNQLVDTGAGWVGVNKTNLQAAPVVLGGGQPPAPQQFTGADGVPVQIAGDLPPNVQAAIRQAEMQGGAIPDGAEMMAGPAVQGGGQQLRSTPNPAEQQRLAMAEEANQRAAEASQRAAEAAEAAKRGNAPAGFRFKPDGSLEPIPGGPKPAGSAATEGERKAATLLQRLNSSTAQLEQAVSDDPTARGPSVAAEMGRSIPFVGQAAANVINSPARQRVEAAQLDILDAALTLGTGAAYTREQLEGYRRAYFPQIGDSPETQRDKAARLQNVIGAAKIAAGRAAASVEGAQGGQDAPRSTAIKRARNPQTGEVVELRNGAWVPVQ